MLRTLRPVVAVLRRGARRASSAGRNSLPLSGRAKSALQVRAQDVTETESFIRPKGISASQSMYTWMPTVDSRDPVLACQKTQGTFAELVHDPIDTGEFALTEAAALTVARSSYPPGTNARALADAGDLKGLMRAMNLKWRIVDSADESGFSAASSAQTAARARASGGAAQAAVGATRPPSPGGARR